VNFSASHPASAPMMSAMMKPTPGWPSAPYVVPSMSGNLLQGFAATTAKL
jgi:hypothetical protein